MRSRRALVRKREVSLFLLIGGGVAVLGHALLAMLIGAGVVADLANAIQIVLTLQVSFLAHDFLTWRPGRSGSATSGRSGGRRDRACAGAR